MGSHKWDPRVPQKASIQNSPKHKHANKLFVFLMNIH